MVRGKKINLSGFDQDAATLGSILEGTATETGERFFSALVENLAKALRVHGAWVTEYLEESRRLRALAFWLDGQFVPDYEYDISGTPCEPVVENTCLIHIPEKVVELYPKDPDLPKAGAVSYMGFPLLDIDERVLGHLAVIDTQPMPEDPKALALFRIFAARAAAELQRLRAEAEVRKREEELKQLVNSAMDAIIQLDQDLRVTLVNPAAEKIFKCPKDEILGLFFKRFLGDKDVEKLDKLIKELNDLPEARRYLWIAGGLQVICAEGEQFQAEATISQFEMQKKIYYTLILRNVNERIQAEEKIRSLTVETEYLKEELKALLNLDEIIGQSEPMLRVLQDVAQVADTGSTVLILGETGTGKELIARAIHFASRRRDKPFIKVNCAAIPATLMESEFFGHEQGAFTGATKKREGRFSLADGGTIFLDEVGELPLDLQVKLLRVLQEGEFEPVGSSHTKKVDVRVIAATNRDLHKAVQNGDFRKDLYYRLNVFPVEVPPLREREDDIVLIASTFAQRFARRMGRTIEPLSDRDIKRLKSYNWPGNVRELQNVVERAVITSQGGRLNLDRALPEIDKVISTTTTALAEEQTERIRTIHEIEELERQNLIRALEATNWRVSGENGAARLLGMNSSTLSSRMKALGIKRPR
ncbi:MAG TPA: sigma 54-interacting transcriptional regulator [Thermodesulfobacteriota bacterium]|nr:sigma 54-interacting transcriptional regulator [Thermodesulfobacteriota bacterium]